MKNEYEKKYFIPAYNVYLYCIELNHNANKYFTVNVNTY